MANGLSMKVLLQLQTKNFEKGIGTIKKSINGIKNTMLGLAGAFGVGLGFNSLISSLKDTATKLSVAKATLENVSLSTTEYAENMNWLKSISDKYGQSVLALTQSFAQFKAAAKSSSMSLEEQKDIYEALTKAAGAFHLSEEQTSNAMLAVIQMISKGKVASEELRRQLANSIPGAFNLMAQAAYQAGIITTNSTKAFEDAMKAGKVTADKVLPYFAQELNKITASANFDSLQSSLNRFSNAWVNLTDKMNVEQLFKKITDFGSKALEGIGNNLKEIKQWAIAVGAAIASAFALKGGTKLYQSSDKFWNLLILKAEEYEKSLKRINKELVKVGNPLIATGMSHKVFSNDEMTDFKTLNGIAGYNEEDLRGIVKLNNEWLKLYETNKKLGRKSWVKTWKSDYEVVLSQTHDLENSLNNFFGGADKANGITKVFKNIGESIKNIISSINWVALIIEAIVIITTKLVQKIKEAKEEEKRINSILKNHCELAEKEYDSIDAQTIMLNRHLKTIKNENSTLSRQKYAISEINKQLGLTGKQQLKIEDGYDKIAESVNRYTEMLKLNSLASFYANEYSKALTNINELETKKNKLIDEADSNPNWKKTNNPNMPYELAEFTTNRKALKEINKVNQEIVHIDKEIVALQSVIDNCNDELDVLGVKISDLFSTGDGPETGGDDVISDLQKRLDEYKKKVNELGNQLKRGSIDHATYNQELEKETESVYKDITALDELDTILKDLGKDYAELADKIRNAAEASKFRNKVLDMEQEAYERSQKEGQIANEWDKLDKSVKSTGRDTFFDYKKEDVEILEEEADAAKEYKEAIQGVIDKIKEFKDSNTEMAESTLKEINTVLGALQEQLKKAGDAAEDFGNKAKIAQKQADLKKLQDELKESNWDNLKEGGNIITDVVSNVHSLGEAIEDLDEKGKDAKFYDYWEVAVDSIGTVVTLLESVLQLIQGINEAKELQKSIEKLNGSSNVSAMASEYALQQAINQEKERGIALEQQNTTATMQGVAANLIGAGAEGLKGGASAGWPRLLWAIPAALAAVAGGIATVKAIKGFANGGIIGGNSYSGDKMLARVNSGELVLNKSQQSTLYNAIKSGNLGTGGNVTFEIKGDRLVGVLNNYHQKIKG